MRKHHTSEIYALLWVSYHCKNLIEEILNKKYKVPRNAIVTNPHLTVYHGRRQLPGLLPDSQAVRIIADTTESRFMVLAPGGENPRPELEPSKRSVGIRLTKRNLAISQIQELRASVSQLETQDIVGKRKRTTAWSNCFGARHYQPHIKLLYPGSKIDRDLTKLGLVFRSEIDYIVFDRFEIRCRTSQKINRSEV